MRGHTLPLPYLRSPSMSFLVHLSPHAYLTLLRTPQVSTPSIPKSPLPSIDIPFQTLRSRLAAHPPLPGATIATLILATASSLSPSDSLGMHSLASRPVYVLTPMSAPPDYHFFDDLSKTLTPAFPRNRPDSPAVRRNLRSPSSSAGCRRFRIAAGLAQSCCPLI